MMLRLWVLTLALLLPSTSWAAISVISNTESVSSSVSVSSIATSVTVGSTSANHYLIIQAQNATLTGGNVPVTGATFEGQNFTIGTGCHAVYSAGNNRWMSTILYLQNPPAATGDVTVNWSGSGNERMMGYSVILADGIASFDKCSTSSGTGSTAREVSITPSGDGSLIVDSINTNTGTITVGAGQTQQSNRTLSGRRIGTSTLIQSTAAAKTMTWTTTSGFEFAYAAASFNASGGTDPGTSAPIKATLTWTNGSDQGTPQTGVISATILRCTGPGCTPTTNLITIPATNGSAGSYVDNSVVPDTTYGYSFFNSDGVGLKSVNYTPTQYITTGGTFRNVLGVRDFSLLADNTDIGTDFDAGYTSYSSCSIVSGTLRATTINDGCLESYNVANPNDQWVRLTFPTFSNNLAQVGAWCRLTNPGSLPTGYVAFSFLDVPVYKIYEVTNNNYVELASAAAGANVDGDHYRFECQGTTQKFYRIRNGAEVLLAESSDATITSGKTGVSIYVPSGALDGLQLNHFVMGGFSTTQDVAPTIIGLTVDPTGANLTHGAVTATQYIVRLSNNQTSTDVLHPISDAPGGRHTQTWLDGWTSVCFLPVDSLGVLNTLSAAYRCVSLAGLTTSVDTTPPVLSGCKPDTDLPAGSTTATVSCVPDKPAFCNIDTTDIPVLTMQTTIAMSTAGLVCSVELTGLSAGTITRYVGAYTAHPFDLETFYPTVTNQAITITILASAGPDTTRPTDVTNFVCTLSGLEANCTWTAATDAGGIFGYQVYQSNDACVTPVLAGLPVTTTSKQVNLAYNATYCWTVKAIDTSNNLSLNHSNTFSLTTGPRPDLFPPSDMANLQANCGYTASCVLTWNNPTDEDSTLITSSIEFCLVVSPSTDCSNFTAFQSLIFPSTLKLDLASSTRYCFRGQHSDGTNVGGYSATVCGTTNATGVGTGRPRASLRFGTTRATPSESYAPSVDRPIKP